MQRLQILLLIGILLTAPGTKRPVHAQAPASGAEPLPLAAYPRPEGDNGRGVHYVPTVLGQPREMVDFFVGELVSMNVKWVKVMQGDSPKVEHRYLIEQLVAHDIEPILRVYKPYNDPYRHLDELVPAARSMGVHYFELYNEPNLAGRAGGWRPGEAISRQGRAYGVARILDLWIPAAEAVRAGGGYPGLPTLAPGGDYADTRFLAEFLDALRARGRTDLLNNAWLPLHNYFFNHPLDYPRDPVNLRGVPLRAREIEERGLTPAQVRAINTTRADDTPLGRTIHEDSNGFRKFEAYARIFYERFHRYVPIISTEGGAIVGDQQDPRYPPVTVEDVTERTLGAYHAMLDEAPAYYFAFTPWLLANRAGGHADDTWERAAWYRADGRTLPIVTALKADPRRFETKPWRTPDSRAAQSDDMTASTQYTADTSPRADVEAAVGVQTRIVPAGGDGPTWEVTTARWQTAGAPYSRLLVDLRDQHGKRIGDVQVRVRWSGSWTILMTGRFGAYSATLPLADPTDTYRISIAGAGGQAVEATGAPGYDLLVRLRRSGAPQTTSAETGASGASAIPRPGSGSGRSTTPTTAESDEADASPNFWSTRVYHLSCEENRGMARLRVIVRDAAGRPLDDVPLEFDTMDGKNAVRAKSGVKAPGVTEFSLMASGGGRWRVRVAPTTDTPGSAWVEDLRTDMWDTSCPAEVPNGNTWGHHSYDVTFQAGGQPSSAASQADGDSAKATPWAGAWEPGQSRRPTASWSPADVWPLARWPRPSVDTGYGLHYVPVGHVREDASDVDEFIADLQRMGMTWATVLYADEHALERAAPKFRDAGIMVVWRPYLRPYERYLYAERDIKLLEAAGMPPYIQLYNEPDVRSEWKGEPIPDFEERDAIYIDNWIAAADAVWQRGGFPGIQVTSPTLLRKLLQTLRRRGQLYLLNHTFFVAHPYGSNHPPAYPYDPVNQQDNPGATIDDDWTGVLGFQTYAHVFQDEVGFVPPIIAGEGGWTVSILEDGRYPRVTPELHRDWHLEVVDWFRTGRLSNGDPLPDYFFAFTFWLYKDAGRLFFADSAWFDSALSGTKRATIDALARRPPFRRQFSWSR